MNRWDFWPDFDNNLVGEVEFSVTVFYYPILKVDTGKILSVRNSVVDPFTVQIFSISQEPDVGESPYGAESLKMNFTLLSNTIDHTPFLWPTQVRIESRCCEFVTPTASLTSINMP